MGGSVDAGSVRLQDLTLTCSNLHNYCFTILSTSMLHGRSCASLQIDTRAIMHCAIRAFSHICHLAIRASARNMAFFGVSQRWPSNCKCQRKTPPVPNV